MALIKGNRSDWALVLPLVTCRLVLGLCAKKRKKKSEISRSIVLPILSTTGRVLVFIRNCFNCLRFLINS